MKIYNFQKICGLSSMQLKTLLSKLHQPVDSSVFIYFTQKSEKKAMALLQELESHGFIERAGEKIVISVRGKIWTETVVHKAMSDQTAQKKLDLLLNRIHSINNDPKFLYTVEEAWLHKLYLSENKIDSIEVLVLVSRKQKDNKLFEVEMRKITEGKNTYSVIGEFYYPILMISSFLKSGIHHLNVYAERNISNYLDSGFTLFYKRQKN